MSTELTGKQISNTYNQLLKVNVSTNTGLTGTVQTIQSGDATNSALQLSQGVVNINGTFALNGTDLTADASALNAITDLSGITGLVAMNGGSAAGRTLTAGSGITISNANGTAGNPTIAVSLTGVHISAASAHFTGNVTASEFWGALKGNVDANSIESSIGSFNGRVSATDIKSVSINTTNLVATTGSFTTKVSGVAAEFSGNVSVGASIYAAGGVYTGTVSAGYFVGDGSGLTNVPSAEGGTVKRVQAGTGISITVDGATSTAIPVSGTILVAANQPGIETLATVSVGKVAVSAEISAPSGAIVRFNGDVSTDNLYAATNVYIGGSAIPDASFRTSINNVVTSINTVIANTSSALATSIGNSNTLITTVSGALATSIGNSNTNITTNTNAITSINTVIGDGTGFVTDSELATVSAALATSIGNTNTVLAATSSALATSIGNSNTNITTNASAITSINTVVANVSAALALSIGNSNSAITSINAVIGDGTGFVTDSELATVSAALATSIANRTSAITSINTVLAATSSALATSIGNHLPLTGGTLTGIVSGTDIYVSAIAIGVNTLLGKDLHIEAAAVADIVSLTDGANISVDFNAGQNFHLTLAGNRTLDNPTNCVPGQVGSIFIVQDGSGSRTLAYGTSWEFIGGTAPTLTTDAAAVDRLDYIVRTSTAVQSILSQGYS
ncbi:MAG: hypothetical protein CL831_00395 [Crocinitomicaceae bacterium]|nr:hypothetical protein [Crocinitomicaceae bacterium]